VSPASSTIQTGETTALSASVRDTSGVGRKHQARVETIDNATSE
jgi:hypothetical protein